MIRPEKLDAAAHALQRLIVVARMMAYRREDSAKIADLLDRTEYLPRMLAGTVDKTEEFESYLRSIAVEFPTCRAAVEAFEGTAPGTPF